MNLYVYKNIEQKIKKIFRKDEAIQIANHKFNNFDCNFLFKNKIRIHCGASSENTLYINDLFRHQNSPARDTDFFIVPLSINIHASSDIDFANKIVKKVINCLDYFGFKPHIFFLVGDNSEELNCLKNSIVFRSSCTLKSKNIPLHYNVIDFGFEDILETKNDIFFQGCINCDLRKKIKNTIGLPIWGKKSIIFEDRCGAETQPKIEYLNKLKKSKFILCPKGLGTNSIRFYETISCGRIPVLISDNLKLPFDKEIEYKNFVIFIPENEIYEIPSYIDQFLLKNSLSQASNFSRFTWQKYFKKDYFFKYLSSSIYYYIKKNRIH